MVEQNRIGTKENSAKTVTPAEAGSEQNACRCEEVSRMTPRQLLQVMMRDLAFWKRPEK